MNTNSPISKNYRDILETLILIDNKNSCTNIHRQISYFKSLINAGLDRAACSTAIIIMKKCISIHCYYLAHEMSIFITYYYRVHDQNSEHIDLFSTISQNIAEIIQLNLSICELTDKHHNDPQNDDPEMINKIYETLKKRTGSILG